MRYRPDTGFEIWCPDCQTFWPADEEFWPLKYGLQRCLDCNRTKKNKAEQTRRKLMAEQIKAANATYRRENRCVIQMKNKARRVAKKTGLAVAAFALLVTNLNLDQLM